MTTLPLVLALALAAPGTVARHPRPGARDTTRAEAEAPQATPLSDDEVADRARTYLASIDTPISAAQWKELGPRAVPLLEEVVHDANALPSRRARAVAALSMIGGDRARSIVLEVARSDHEPFGVRASALRGAPRLLAARDLSQELRPVLEKARDPSIRATAAEVLARHGDAGACTAVRAQVERETSRARAQFSRALERCPTRP